MVVAWTAWACAVGGLALGSLASLVPGFPGCAIALLGVAAYAGITDFQIVTRPALALAAVVALTGALCQLLAPVVSARAAGGTAGAATGAMIGATAGVLVALPGAGVLGATVGALVGGLAGSRGERWTRRLRGAAGAASGCAVSVLADLVAVLGVGAVLAISELSAAWPAP